MRQVRAMHGQRVGAGFTALRKTGRTDTDREEVGGSHVAIRMRVPAPGGPVTRMPDEGRERLLAAEDGGAARVAPRSGDQRAPGWAQRLVYGSLLALIAAAGRGSHASDTRAMLLAPMTVGMPARYLASAAGPRRESGRCGAGLRAASHPARRSTCKHGVDLGTTRRRHLGLVSFAVQSSSVTICTGG